MATLKGRERVRRFLRVEVPEALEGNILRGAARAAGKVLADEARERTTSDTVRGAIVVQPRHSDGVAKVVITVKGRWASSLAKWLEWGTAGHFISIDEAQRGGRGLLRINQQVREAGGDRSLVIGGQFVGTTVWHPGASPHPFLRPSLDLKEAEAVSAAQKHVRARLGSIGRGRIRPEDDGDG